MSHAPWSGFVISALAVAGAIASGCGGDGAERGVADDGEPAGAAQTVRSVEGAGDPRTAWTFEPFRATVSEAGEIVFTNAGSEVHTATADDGSFDTGTLSPGDSISVSFDKAGTFAYHCSLHPWMKGEVVVEPAS